MQNLRQSKLRLHTLTALPVVAGSLLGLASDARAQLTEPVLPNVLLVVDNTDEMNKELGTGNWASCPTGKSRYITALEALTGTINQYACHAPSGTSQRPWWSYPYWHHRWPVSNHCIPAANHESDRDYPGNEEKWLVRATGGVPAYASEPINFRKCDSGGGVGCDTSHVGGNWYSRPRYTGGPPANRYCQVGPGGWDQSTDGLLDIFGNGVRFGLMMTDDLPSAEVAPYQDHANTDSRPPSGGPYARRSVNYGGDFFGNGYNQWLNDEGSISFQGNDLSYWYNAAGTWASGANTAGHARGQLEFFPSTVPWEVGVRNRRARPWAGRMMGFGDFNAKIKDEEDQNKRIQLVLLGTSTTQASTNYPGSDWSASASANHYQRGFPIAGAMKDVREFLLNDTTQINQYLETAADFEMSITGDPATCRKTSVVLLVGSQPGMDMTELRDGWHQTDQQCTPNPIPLPGCTYQPPTVACGASGICPYDDGATYRRAAHHALDLASRPDPINTNVVALLEQPNAYWDNGGTTDTVNCEDITLSASYYGAPGSNTMCAWNGQWEKHDPNAQPGQPGYNVRACCEYAEVALSGGGKLYLPQNLTEIKAALSEVVSGVTTQLTARTTPVFAKPAATFVPADNPAAIGYEIMGGLKKTTSGMWRGQLERRRLICDGSDEPVRDAISNGNGDNFEVSLNAGRDDRRFFTVVPEDATDANRTLRPQTTNTDDLYGPGSMKDFTDLAPAGTPGALNNNLYAAISSAVTSGGYGYNAAEELLGVSPTLDVGVNRTCDDTFGVTTLDTCGDRILDWYTGISHGYAITPSFERVLGAPGCADCSPLGGIYHSNPVVVGPPNEPISDELYNTAFAVYQSERPTMVYQQTVDGQLHAFVLAKNSGAPVAGRPDYSGVHSPNSGGSTNEQWTFIPPAALTRVWDNFNSHTLLLDGPLTTGNVVYKRTAADAQTANAGGDNNGGWATVLIGSSGLNSSAGGYYYALDVTDPMNPRFLWQLKDDENGVSLFGAGVPGATITHMPVDDGAGNYYLAAVAFLPGGVSPDPTPSTARDRFKRGDADQAAYARPKIRDWGSSAARSLTVVEIKTGRVLARFVGADDGSNPSAADSSNNVFDGPELDHTGGDANLFFAGLDSPITSPVVVENNLPGQQTTRAYFGDADGTVWRLEYLDRDPSNWNLNIVHDPFVGVGGTDDDEAVAGQPIEASIVITTDETLNPTLIVATGSQEGFGTETIGMKNFLSSITEVKTIVSPFYSITTNDILQFNDGERVTGSMSVFNNMVNFSTYVPDAAACSVGVPRIWGVPYLAVTGNGIDTDLDGSFDAPNFSLDPNTVVFGVSINLVPACFTTPINIGDGWLGGSSATTTNNAGKFQMVFQTGAPDGGEAQQGASNASRHIDDMIKAPTRSAVLQSWATVSD